MEAEGGQTAGGRRTGERAERLPARTLSLLATIVLCLLTAPAAIASSTWDGAAGTSAKKWSVAKNWQGESAPKEEEGVGALIFPALGSPCEGKSEPAACYHSEDDVNEVSAEALQIDDGDNYVITGGDELSLGAGGLTARPEGRVSGALDEIETPLELIKSQRWTVAGRGGGGAKDGLLLEDELTGKLTGAERAALTIALSREAALVIGSKAEVEAGPVTIEGADGEAKTGFENGSVELLGGELDRTNKGHVTLSHISFSGFGEAGALTSTDAELDISQNTEHSGLEASSVTLDHESKVAFEIGSEESAQLLAAGPIALGGATLALYVPPPVNGASCTDLAVGAEYVFVSAAGGLSGAFVNAPGGAETVVPIHFPEGCIQARAMRIGYRTGSEPQTVTGTVVEAPPVATEGPEPAAVAEGHGPLSASRSLGVSSSGTFAVKVKCAAPKTASCVGTVTLRTLHAVSIAVSGHKAKRKPAVLKLASASFKIAGGHTSAVTLHLSATAKKLLAHDHSLQARATIVMRVLTQGHLGKKRTTQTTVTLHAPKAKSAKV